MADAKPVAEAPTAETTPVVDDVQSSKQTEVAEVAEVVDASTAPDVVAEATETKVEGKGNEEINFVEEGSLEYRGQGTNFPKNLIFSKKLFWFGNEAVDLKPFSAFKDKDKATEVAWASETGKGLLFYSEKSDKSHPHGAILLAGASEVMIEGAFKFYFTAKGHKHSFRAGSSTERDSWTVALRSKMAEARELAATVTESEKYQSSLESAKPVTTKKEDKAGVDTATDAGAGAGAGAAAVAAPATPEEPVKETVAESSKEDVKDEGTKRRSASRKRTSFFGIALGGKKESSSDIKVAEAETPTAEPAVDAAAADVAPVEPTTATETPAAEDRAEEAKEARATPIKRQSLFGNLSFGKKKSAAEPTTPTAEASASTEVAENAPVIPAVGSVEPLSAEVASPATVPTETVDASPSHVEPKKESKTSEKRKSSLPFAFGKKDKSSTSDDEGEKIKTSPFSKLRATIKGKGKAEKVEEKKEDSVVVPETGEASKGEENVKPESAAPAAPATEEAPKVESTPAVTAAA